MIEYSHLWLEFPVFLAKIHQMSADVKVALGKIADAIQSTRPDCPTVEVIRDGGGIKLLIADPNYTNQTLRIKCRGIGNRACPLCPVKNRSIVVRLGVEN